jgi:hypothetical protein
LNGHTLADFASIDSVGPQRAAKFVAADELEIDAVAADALGYVADLLGACREVGLLPSAGASSTGGGSSAAS